MGNKSSSNRDDSDRNPSNVNRQNETPQSQSYYSMIKNSYQSLVNAIIRPPRCQYDLSQLGPSQFNFCGKAFIRTDFYLTNPRNLKICCSRWEPLVVGATDDQAANTNTVLPCVIYMHGNSSSRLEALSSLSLVLSLGATLISFDFAGSGMSEGEYVSLGAFEKDDLQCVIEFLRSEGKTSTIALWGRSMGAATALLHGERDPSIAAMVLDSTFSSLLLLAEEMVETGRQQGLFAPGILVRIVMQFVRSSVLKAAEFDIRKLAPIDSADKCYIPAMFIAAEHDRFVRKTHSILIHGKYSGDKNIVIVEGDHNSKRPIFLYDSIGIFLSNTLQIPESWHLSGSENYIRKQPWLWTGSSSSSSTIASQSLNSLFYHGDSGRLLTASVASRIIDHTTAIGTGTDVSDNQQQNTAIGSHALALDGIDITMDELLALQFGAYNDDDDDDESFAAYDTSAEEQMQMNVQNRLFQLFNNTGTGGVIDNTPPITSSSTSNLKVIKEDTDTTAISAVSVNNNNNLSTNNWQCMTCAAHNNTNANIKKTNNSVTYNMRNDICNLCGTKRYD